MPERQPSEDFLKASKALMYTRTAQGAGIGFSSGVGLGTVLTVMAIGGSHSGSNVTLTAVVGVLSFMGVLGGTIGAGAGLAAGSSERSQYILKQLEAPKPQAALPPPAEPPAGPLI